MLYRFLLASSIGTFLEFFDIALYSFASNLIAQHFFPADNPKAAILATWGVFAVSYLMRPLGAIWFGYIADVKSSRTAMLISMSFMAISTSAIGLLPTYASIGLWAPILLLLLRIIQSIAVSPEYNLPSVFIKNNGWCKQHFGLVSSISAAVTGLGIMSASWVLGNFIHGAHDWRILFILAGILVGTLGIYLRWNLDQNFNHSMPKIVPLKQVLTKQTRDFLQAVFIAGYIGCVSYALFGFLVHQLQTLKLLTTAQSLKVLSSGGLLLPGFCLLAGYLSDKIAREKLMFVSSLCIACSGYYLFTFMQQATIYSITIYTCTLLASLGFFAGSFPGYLAEMFKKEYRYTGSFLAYNLGMSWIGGISPLMFISAANFSYAVPGLIIVLYSLVIMVLVVKPEFRYEQSQQL